MREIGFMEKVISRLRSPLASVPECKHLARVSETIRHGYMAPAYRVIAEHLVFAVQYTVHSSVEGDIAEFGVQTGRTSNAIAAAMKLMRADKTLHLFDSFEGLPEATSEVDKENEHVKSGVWGAGQLKAITPEQLRKNCRRFLPDDSIKIYKGWFSDSLPTLSPGTKFAMLHIDCDLYSSTMDVLEYVLQKGALTEGAIILFDDWGCNRSSNEHGERKAWKDICDKYHVKFTDLGGYAWAGQKFVVHSYVRP
jgi:O-methyltransferase